MPSNTTNMVHSEQMFKLDGPIRLGWSKSQGRLQIENHSQLFALSVALVERTSREDEAGRSEPALQGMWIGELRPARVEAGAFTLPIAVKKDAGAVCGRAGRGRTAAKLRRGSISSRCSGWQLDVSSFEPGEKRLVARIDDVLPGETIAPAASQVRGACWSWPTWITARGRNRCRTSTRGSTWSCVRSRNSGPGFSGMLSVKTAIGCHPESPVPRLLFPVSLLP